MTKDSTNYLNEGFMAQHTIFGRLANKYKDLPRYTIEESPEGSTTDMVDKIDITLTDNTTNTKKYFDVKSSKYPNQITYTHINGIGQKSKIYKGNCDIDLIFTFDTYNSAYFVKASDFNKALLEKIKNNKEQQSKTKSKSKYVWFTLNEVKALAYDKI